MGEVLVSRWGKVSRVMGQLLKSKLLAVLILPPCGLELLLLLLVLMGLISPAGDTYPSNPVMNDRRCLVNYSFVEWRRMKILTYWIEG
jgi:hypothetical protein